MSKNIHRGFVATLVAGALTLSLAPLASAGEIDTDGPEVVAPPAETVRSAEVFRIADSTRILTAIEASQSRSDWGGGLRFISDLRWDCSAPIPLDGQPTPEGIQEGDSILVIDGFVVGVLGGFFNGIAIPVEFDDIDFELLFGEFFGQFAGNISAVAVECEAVELGQDVTRGRMDIIVARADDYPDALAAGPLADVRNAPILLNPRSALDADVKAEINRLGALGGNPYTTVHILGGTNALSDGVKDAIDNLVNVDNVVRYQGIDRYETAVGIATQTVNDYNFATPFDPPDVNAYITTGINFPDALAAGAAAADNDGVVVLTDGEELDRRGFTEEYLINLSNLVIGGVVNTSENFAVGGPSAAAAETYDIRLAPNAITNSLGDTFEGAYVGKDRYETATLLAQDTFDDPGFEGDFAVVSGEGFADALVAGGFIANLDGPLLLSRAETLTKFTSDYLFANVQDGDRVFTFGGPDSLRLAVTEEIKALLEAKFAIDPEIR